jgi:hypothetical protein
MEGDMTRRFRATVLVLLTACTALFLVCGAAGSTNSPADARVDAFKAALAKQGFIVQEGRLAKFDLVPLCCSGKIPTCLANNAGAPYMAAIMPMAPGQTADSTFPWLFRLGANEAIVIVGRTPPPTAYFSYQPFGSILYSEKTGAREFLNAVHTSGTHEDPFNRDVIIVATADQGIDSRVRAAARSAGYPESILNTSVIPAALLRLGIDTEADEFAFFHRMFLPQSQQDLDNYMNTPQLALRVTLKDSVTSIPFPVPELRVRGTGRTEMDLMPAVEELRKAILQKYGGLQATELTTSVWLADGYDGIQREVNLYGPTRHTIYLRTDPVFKLPDGPDDFVMVYGVNHEATGKATYSNLAAYADPTLLLGVKSDNSRHFAGSATDYLPDDPQVESLYAWKVARNCHGDPHCLEVTLDDCAALDLNTLPDMWMGFRIYLEPETKVGTAFTDVIYDRAIVFSSRPAASPTPTALPGAGADWRTYLDSETGFAISHPPTWSRLALGDPAECGAHALALIGPEGGVMLSWGAPSRGACARGTQKIKVGQGELTACYTKSTDRTEVWDQINLPLSETTAVSARAYTSNANPASREAVLKVLSTLQGPRTSVGLSSPASQPTPTGPPAPAPKKTTTAAARTTPSATRQPTAGPTKIALTTSQPAWQVETLLVAPGEPGRLYALMTNSSGPLWAFPASNVRLMISDDFAKTWDSFPGGLPVPANCMVNVSLDYAAPDALYASTCQGLYVWDRNGKTWAKRSDRLTDAVSVAYGQPNTVWAAAHGDGIIRSTDGAKTWQNVSTGLVTFGGMASLGIDPRDANTLYGIIQPKYAGSYLRRGTAAGNWDTMPTPKDNATIDTGMAIDGASGALYLTTQLPPVELWRSPNPSAANFADVQWELVQTFQPATRVVLLASGWGPQGRALYASIWPSWFDENNPSTDNAALSRSLDGGHTWEELAMP